MTIEARLVGDWAEAYPKPGHLALILPLALEGGGTVGDMRLRVEGISRPLAWVGCWYGGAFLARPASVKPPVSIVCVFQGEGVHQVSYRVTLEGAVGRTWRTWQTWGEFDLRPGVARYVVRPNTPIGKGQAR